VYRARQFDDGFPTKVLPTIPVEVHINRAVLVSSHVECDIHYGLRVWLADLQPTAWITIWASRRAGIIKLGIHWLTPRFVRPISWPPGWEATVDADLIRSIVISSTSAMMPKILIERPD
jgi:hypothetical protein